MWHPASALAALKGRRTQWLGLKAQFHCAPAIHGRERVRGYEGVSMTPPRRPALRQPLRLLLILPTALALVIAWSAAVPGVDAHASAGSVANAASVGGCPLFPADNIWNRDISALPASSKSATYIASIGASATCTPTSVLASTMAAPSASPIQWCRKTRRRCRSPSPMQTRAILAPIRFRRTRPSRVECRAMAIAMCWWCRAGPASCYEVYAGATGRAMEAGRPAAARSGGSTRMPCAPTRLDLGGCRGAAHPSGAGALRRGGERGHRARPALHRGPDTKRLHLAGAAPGSSATPAPNLPPMGLRLRLRRASISRRSRGKTGDPDRAQALRDDGWRTTAALVYLGTPDDRWNNDDLAQLKRIPGSDFEVVDTARLQVSANSGQARGSQAGQSTPTPTGRQHARRRSLQSTPTNETRTQTSQRGQTASAGFQAGPLLLAISGVAALGLLGLGLMMWRQRRLPYDGERRDETKCDTPPAKAGGFSGYARPTAHVGA